MSENKENNGEPDTFKVIGALLVGAAIGAGIGILFSSEEGKKIREMVTDEIKDFVGNVKGKMGINHCPGCNCKTEDKTV